MPVMLQPECRCPLAARKLAWLLETGGALISDDGARAVVLKDDSYGIIDVWGKVVWQPKVQQVLTLEQAADAIRSHWDHQHKKGFAVHLIGRDCRSLDEASEFLIRALPEAAFMDMHEAHSMSPTDPMDFGAFGAWMASLLFHANKMAVLGKGIVVCQMAMASIGCVDTQPRPLAAWHTRAPTFTLEATPAGLLVHKAPPGYLTEAV